MKGLEWIVIDTETTGLGKPIYILEIYGQRMRNWKPIGSSFHAYINHHVPIPSYSTAIHGITKEFIAENGGVPTDVYKKFSEYVGNDPIVAHHLNYDWDRCLVPECQRLGIKTPGQRGFCTMQLARRLFPETKSVKLETLGKLFNLNTNNSHTASGDVTNLVTLLTKEFSPRLQSAGIYNYNELCKFSTQTPMKKCHDLLDQDVTTPIQFRCSHCSTMLKLPAKEIGKIGRCPICRNEFKISRSL